MSTSNQSVALVGTCGGAGTTRLAVELAATLARAGTSVAILDVDLATQGLADYVPGRIDPDLTTVLTGDATLESSLVTLPWDTPGAVAVAPAYAPFERLARAQTAGAAQSFGEILDSATQAYDHVLVDTPPVATNLAISAVTEVDTVTLVAPASERGENAIQRVRGRLADVGTSEDCVLGNGGDTLSDAEVEIPRTDIQNATGTPAVFDPDDEFAPAVAAAAETLTGDALDLEFPEPGLLERFSN